MSTQEIDYLDVKLVDGSVQQAIRTTTLQKLQAEQNTAAAAVAESIRLFASHDTASKQLPTAELMKAALYAAMRSLKASKKPRINRKVQRVRRYLWSNVAVKELHSDKVNDLVSVIKNLHAGDVVVDFSSLDDMHVLGIVNSYKRFYGEEVPQAALLPPRAAEPVELKTPEPLVVIGEAVRAQTERDALERLSANRRWQLAKDWLTASEVSVRLGSTAENTSQLATKYRKEGKLLGVYLPVPTATWRFPNWQFKKNGYPVEHFEEILKTLRDSGVFSDSDRRSTGWGEVEWFLSGHMLLDGKAPVDMLPKSPERVLEAAKQEFGGND
ncbi:hypothetical protein [Stenotrophomonas maltophilia]|uniref:hypothetical protein n=1 Tax=Stenotrophomonas maltophilia TaxID=40324 RepID=UPI0021ADF218|nr:hypothetical protein [Stenotrophomonas maltophilia]